MEPAYGIDGNDGEPGTAGGQIEWPSSRRERGFVDQLNGAYGYIRLLGQPGDRVFFHANYLALGTKLSKLVVGSVVDFSVRMDDSKAKPAAVDVRLVAADAPVWPALVTGRRFRGRIRSRPREGRTPAFSENTAALAGGGRVRSDDTPGHIADIVAATGEQPPTAVGLGSDCAVLYYNTDAADPLQDGDLVEFTIAGDPPVGSAPFANDIRLIEKAVRPTLSGTITSIRQQFGFIRRADDGSAIFFHCSELIGDPASFMAGDKVEFVLTQYRGRTTAGSVTHVGHADNAHGHLVEGIVLQGLSANTGSFGTSGYRPVGRIVFWRGQLDASLTGSAAPDPAPVDGGGMTDAQARPDTAAFQVAEFTESDFVDVQGAQLSAGDRVTFTLVGEQRSGRLHASRIALVEPDAVLCTRRRGIVVSVKENFCFVNCGCRSHSDFFCHFSELYDKSWRPSVGDVVAFTPLLDPVTGRAMATRVSKRAQSLTQAELVRHTGVVEAVPEHLSYCRACAQGRWNQTRAVPWSQCGQPGRIRVALTHASTSSPNERNGLSSSIVDYFDRDIVGANASINVGDTVQFCIAVDEAGNQLFAVDVTPSKVSRRNRELGYIVNMRENRYGFIETPALDHAYIFQFSDCNFDATQLQVGDEVSFAVQRAHGRYCAVEIALEVSGSIAALEMVSDRDLIGRIKRTMNIAEGGPYCGMIAFTNEAGQEDTVQYGALSLEDRDYRKYFRIDEAVRFRIAKSVALGGTRRAVHVQRCDPEPRLRARVKHLKEGYGFLSYHGPEVVGIEGDLFFHMNDVLDNVELHVDDEVEFSLGINPARQQYFALQIKRVSESTFVVRHPLRRETTDAGAEPAGPRLTVVRQPRGPDGTRGFRKTPASTAAALAGDAAQPDAPAVPEPVRPPDGAASQ